MAGTATKNSALAFRIARRQNKTEVSEDYVEAIADLIAKEGEARVVALSQRIGVSHVTVVRTTERLVAQGLIETAPHKSIRLTEAGRCLADRCRRRHAIVENVLIKLGVPAKAARLDAEGIEHHVSETTLKAFERYIKS